MTWPNFQNRVHTCARALQREIDRVDTAPSPMRHSKRRQTTSADAPAHTAGRRGDEPRGWNSDNHDESSIREPYP